MSREELQAKFRIATRRTMGREEQEELLSTVDSLAAGDLAPLLRALARPLAAMSTEATLSRERQEAT
jgi:hypothetical protein